MRVDCVSGDCVRGDCVRGDCVRGDCVRSDCVRGGCARGVLLYLCRILVLYFRYVLRALKD